VTGTLTWWGHSTSTWLDQSTSVLFDPVLTARLGHLRRVRGSVPPPEAAHTDLVLISHLHADHMHLPSLRLVTPSAVFITPVGSRRLLTPLISRGLEVREVEPGDLVEVAGLRVHVLAADHDGRRYPGSPHRGPALGYLVEGSRRCWYPGDTGPEFAYPDVGHIDIALVPVGGWGPNLGPGHLDARQAAEAVRRIPSDRASICQPQPSPTTSRAWHQPPEWISCCTANRSPFECLVGWGHRRSPRNMSTGVLLSLA